MSAGLFALLDDVAALARMAAASVDDIGAAAGRASTKAAGVVIDDTAVTPQYVRGLAAKRELPIIARIAKGSLRNKLVIILPVALLLSQFLPWLLTPILMLGGAYLCYEAAEKIWHAITARFGAHGDGGHHDGHADGKGDSADGQPAAGEPAAAEEQMVSGAIRTDLILSAEIMVISLNEVAAEGFWSRLVILTVVAIAITIVVYGVVALIVKTDDVGLYLAERSQGFVGRVGRGMVKAMPVVLSVISVVGTAGDGVGRRAHRARRPRRARLACAVRAGAPPGGVLPPRGAGARRRRNVAGQHPGVCRGGPAPGCRHRGALEPAADPQRPQGRHRPLTVRPPAVTRPIAPSPARRGHALAGQLLRAHRRRCRGDREPTLPVGDQADLVHLLLTVALQRQPHRHRHT
jgi:predicted DNA repair protein MutK